jgi:hypothetical protein
LGIVPPRHGFDPSFILTQEIAVGIDQELAATGCGAEPQVRMTVVSAKRRHSASQEA